jgi:hypothetical protein
MNYLHGAIVACKIILGTDALTGMKKITSGLHILISPKFY